MFSTTIKNNPFLESIRLLTDSLLFNDDMQTIMSFSNLKELCFDCRFSGSYDWPSVSSETLEYLYLGGDSVFLVDNAVLNFPSLKVFYFLEQSNSLDIDDLLEEQDEFAIIQVKDLLHNKWFNKWDEDFHSRCTFKYYKKLPASNISWAKFSNNCIVVEVEVR